MSTITQYVQDILSYEVFPELTKDAKRTFVLLMLGMICIYSDSNLIAPNLSAMADEFGFSDIERDEKLGGEIAFAFFLLGVPACVLIGILADSYSRVKLFAFAIFLGQGPNLFIAFVRTYEQLLAIRALTGIAVGGALPLVFSLTGDLFPVNRRSHASALVGVCMSFGVGLGQGIAGYVGSAYGWRTPFVCVALPGVIVGLLFLVTVKEPKRGMMDGNSYSSDDLVSTSARAEGALHDESNEANNANRAERNATSSSRHNNNNNNNNNNNRGEFQDKSLLEQFKIGAKSSWRSMKWVFAVPTNRFALLQGIPGCVPWSMINAFMNDYLAENKGLGVPRATSIMLGFSLGGFLGMIFGGVVGQRAYNESPRIFCNSMAIMVAAGTIPWYYLVTTDDYGESFLNMSTHVFVAIFAGILCVYTGVNVRAMVIQINPPDQRGAAFSLFNLTDDLGRGFGPAIVAKMVGLFGRERAFALSLNAWFLCAFLLFLCGSTLGKDAEDVRTGAVISTRQASKTTNKNKLPHSRVDSALKQSDEERGLLSNQPIPSTALSSSSTHSSVSATSSLSLTPTRSKSR
jgi:MFS family permease